MIRPKKHKKKHHNTAIIPSITKDTTAIVQNILVVTPSPVIHTTNTITVATTPRLPLTPIVATNKTPLFIFLLLCVASIILLHRWFYGTLTTFWQHVLPWKINDRVLQEDSSQLEIASLFIHSLLGAVLGWIGYEFLFVQKNEWLLAMCIVVGIVFFSIKSLLIKVMGYLFQTTKQASSHYFLATTYYTFWLVLLVALFIVVQHVQHYLYFKYIIIGIGATIIASWIYYVAKLFFIKMEEKPVSKYHILLYIGFLEIVPILVLYKMYTTYCLHTV